MESEKSAGLRLLTAPDRLEFFVRGDPFATYRHRTNPPGFSVLNAWDGRAVTRPMCEGGAAFWLGHGDVNGVCFNGEEAIAGTEAGQIVPVETLLRRGSQSVGFQQTCEWQGPGGEVLLTDVRTVRVVPGPSEGAVLDLNVELLAPPDTPVVFGKTDEAFLQLQLASALCPSGGGQIRNSLGEYGLAAHGHNASWCAGVGVVRGQTVGIILLEHPENPWFPVPWMVREDGRISPSPYAWRTGEMAPGSTFRLRYRLLVHRGYVDQGWADARLAAFRRTPILSL